MVKKIAFLLLVFSALQIRATHNRSGEILYKRIPPFVSGNGTPVYTYSITVIKYFDHGTNIADRCVDTVDFGDGSPRGIAARSNGGGWCGNCTNCGDIITNGPNYTVKKNSYTITHTYPGPGFYTVSSRDANRNAGISNIPGSDLVPFYIESLIVIYPSGQNSSPVLMLDPVYKGVVNRCYEFNVCAQDIDGDSLSYELLPCMSAPGQIIPAYAFPPAGAGGSFSIHPATGLLSWCKPQQIGEFSIAIRVNEWRRPYCGMPYALNGYVVRDMQIIIGAGSTPSLITQGFSDGCVVAGNSFSVSLSANSPGFASAGIMALLFPQSGTVIAVSAISSVTTNYAWQTTCTDVQKLPHQLKMAYSVQQGNNISGNYFRQMNVLVIPPAPVITGLVKDTSKVAISWNEPVQCQPGLKEYNIYRRLGAATWTHAACETGVPASSGFQLIANVAAGNSSFVDNNLWGIPDGSMVSYIVTTVMNDCAESYAENIQAVAVIVGLKKETADDASVTLFPNPFSSRLQVLLANNYSGPARPAIYSADGKLLFTTEAEALHGELHLDLGHLAKGIYFLEIKTGRGALYRKLIKE